MRFRMLFGGRRAVDITEGDVRGLIGAVAEGVGVEYKRAIGTNDKARHGFAAEVSSFANTEGGYLFVGIEEEEGVACEIRGVSVRNIDEEILRLENLARTTIAPRLPSFEVAALEVDQR